MKEILHPAQCISRVDINPLWGKKHIVWDLRRDVNILSGVNGIGKSTIMRKMAEHLEHADVPGVTITFDPSDADGIPFDVLHGGETQGLGRLLSRYAYCKADRQTFYRVADELFAVTEKTIVRTPEEILFRQDGEVLTTDQLSAGERQMLAILLTVLVQDGMPCVLFMDEPEISLHFEWQERLISIVRELNPNVQIILSTHSPAIIMSGWMDAVTEVTDITVKG
jgi:predicted ATPase